MSTVGVVAIFLGGIIIGFLLASWVFITVSAEVARNATTATLEKAQKMVKDAP